MNEKALVEQLGFKPKEGKSGIFRKSYKNDYALEVDFGKNTINFGGKIKIGEKLIQNIHKPEDWVVLECVDRLLMKGYEPEDIGLEKSWKTGHGTSGRIDILVYKKGKAFLMIECKTWGAAFDREFKKVQKDGGQLFTYFQQDTHADFLMLYTSEFEKNEVKYKNEIIKIEDHYRTAGNVPDFYDRWSKVTEQNGIFDSWVKPYDFETKALVKAQLKILTEEDSSFIFHEFLSILRKHSVSDKPNAFNKIFNLFLAKIYDEKKRNDEELDFQWKEKEDNNVRFQVRLINLYQEGMLEFLRKEVEGIQDSDFSYKTPEELEERKKKWLKFNNVFAIKEVIDDESFEENARVLKEVVELLQKYQVRYPRKQQHLSDFFERLLTTGLKQESGQFFTPPPIARFIVRSLPIKRVIDEKLAAGNTRELLPAIIDYAAGSGHFLTESMEEMQNIIDQKNPQGLYPEVENQLKVWQLKKYDWAAKYIYGIERDYRLVKVAKVGCYFYGDGLAQVIHGDGLDNFEESKSYRLLLKDNAKKPQFDFVISNPPYSVSTFRGNMKSKRPQNDFELYGFLSDRSSEIECLFIERTKQLLREGGIAAIILPSSILSNSGIYSKTREILFKYFEFVAITELGSNTFMATGTNTVVLFLRRRDDKTWEKIKTYVADFIRSPKDVTVNGVEKVFSKYVAHVWEGLNFADYTSLIQGDPNSKIQAHEIYKEYQKKIKAKNDDEKLDKIVDIEWEKLLYFILAYPQDLVLVKTGEKNIEKAFLGYEFSNRRGSEGIHPIQRGKMIDECTQLFHPDDSHDPTKASTYILDAFEGNEEREIDESLKNHVLRANLADMMTWDRVDFEKNVSLRVKKKLKIESRWELVRLGEVCDLYQPKTITSQQIKEKGRYKVFGANGVIGYFDEYNHEEVEVAITCRGATCGTINFTEAFSWVTGNAMIAKPKNNELLKKYLQYILENQDFSEVITGTAQPQITRSTLAPLKIPLPPLDIQEKIVKEIGVLEKKEGEMKGKVGKLKRGIYQFLESEHKKQPLKSFLDEINPSKQVIKSLDDDLEVSFLSMPDVSNDGEVENLQIRNLKQVKKGYTFFQENDVLFAKITPCMENGKGALVSKLRNNLGFGSTEFFVLRSNQEKILPKILFYITKNQKFREEAEKNMAGASGHRRVPQAFIEDYQIPLPPLPEQQKIVVQIEKIEAKIEKLEAELAQIPTQKEAVLKKYL